MSGKRKRKTIAYADWETEESSSESSDFDPLHQRLQKRSAKKKKPQPKIKAETKKKPQSKIKLENEKIFEPKKIQNIQKSNIKMEDSTKSPNRTPVKKEKTPRKPRQKAISEMPLFVACKDSMIMELEGDETLDLSSDQGAIGRFMIRNGDIKLDIKGKRYQGNFFPSPSLMVVSIGKAFATVESINNKVLHAEITKNRLGLEISTGDIVDQGHYSSEDENEEWRKEQKEDKKLKKKAKGKKKV